MRRPSSTSRPVRSVGGTRFRYFLALCTSSKVLPDDPAVLPVLLARAGQCHFVKVSKCHSLQNGILQGVVARTRGDLPRGFLPIVGTIPLPSGASTHPANRRKVSFHCGKKLQATPLRSKALRVPSPGTRGNGFLFTVKRTPPYPPPRRNYGSRCSTVENHVHA